MLVAARALGNILQIKGRGRSSSGGGCAVEENRHRDNTEDEQSAMPDDPGLRIPRRPDMVQVREIVARSRNLARERMAKSVKRYRQR